MAAELVIRGLSRMLPTFAEYRNGLPDTVVDGGYYTKTVENRPLIGSVGPVGSFVCAALSGYGVMAACAAGELCAFHVLDAELPDYADDFRADRHHDPGYLASIRAETDTGQL